MERMDLYDAQRRPLGRAAERGEKRPEGIYHLMAHILVFHPDGRILIQRRQPFKKYWSGLWDITTGGGARAAGGSLAGGGALAAGGSLAGGAALGGLSATGGRSSSVLSGRAGVSPCAHAGHGALL